MRRRSRLREIKESPPISAWHILVMPRSAGDFALRRVSLQLSRPRYLFTQEEMIPDYWA
jgi:hypothetical protein